MNELYQVLDGLHLNVDFHNEKRLIDDGLLESLDIVMLVDELMCGINKRIPRIYLNGEDETEVLQYIV